MVGDNHEPAVDVVVGVGGRLSLSGGEGDHTRQQEI